MLTNLFQRRVPHILGLYLGGCWIAVEFVNFLTERYLLSDALTDLTLVALFAMVPAVIMLAWFHGTPGKDQAPKIEKVFVPLNLVAMIALASTLFYGKELGATATEVTAVDETGQIVTRMAPKQSFRRKLAVFFFANVDEDEGLDWLQYGVPVMLQRDLEQDSFVGTWSPLDGHEQSGMLSLQRAGFDDGLGAPLPLMRQVAEDRSLPAMLTGQFSRSDGGFAIDAQLHWTNNRYPTEQIAVQGRDPMDAVDALTVEIKRALDVPSVARSMMADLTVAEHFTTSVKAVQAYVNAVVDTAIRNDHEAAEENWLAATAEDPAFSAAHLQRGLRAFQSGQTQSAQPSIQAARQHDYKLLHGEKFILKALEYSVDGQADKVTSVYQTWSELYPDDFDARMHLAFSQMYGDNNVSGAIQTLERMRQLAPTEYWLLTQLSMLYPLNGDTATALNLLGEYSVARPQDFTPWLFSGFLRLADGDLARAREDLARADVMSSGRVDPVLALANLNLREGLYDEAQARIDDARSIASAPRQDAAVLKEQIKYFRQRGMLDEVVNSIDELYQTDAAYRNPINLMMASFIDYIEDFVTAGKDEDVLARLAQYDGQFQAPLSELVQVGYLRYYLATGDIERSRISAERVRIFIEAVNREDMIYANDMAQARIHELSGDLPAAIVDIRSGIEKFGLSVQSAQEIGLRVLLQTMMADYLLRNGELDESMRVLQKLLVGQPAHPIANLTLAKVFVARGDKDNAHHHLEVALQAWTNARDDYKPAREARELAASF